MTASAPILPYAFMPLFRSDGLGILPLSRNDWLGCSNKRFHKKLMVPGVEKCENWEWPKAWDISAMKILILISDPWVHACPILPYPFTWPLFRSEGLGILPFGRNDWLGCSNKPLYIYILKKNGGLGCLDWLASLASLLSVSCSSLSKRLFQQSTDLFRSCVAMNPFRPKVRSFPYPMFIQPFSQKFALLRTHLLFRTQHYCYL